MEYGKKWERNIPRCLECGDVIRYGRTDKKFCCQDCKTRHHNNMAKGSRVFKRRIMSTLSRNYGILDELVKADVESIDLTDIVAMGFSPDIVTSYHKIRCHQEYCCFDIKYIMTSSRICSISKIQNVSLPLHDGMKIKVKDI
ncbi:MAG: hypothetical protein E7117_03585 [Bacteroidales bacterium]|nr:hypothetical protein [Bacteroidales bacterium]